MYDADDIEETIDAAERAATHVSTDGSITIDITPVDKSTVIDAAERALARLGTVYVRARHLVHVVHDHTSTEWIVRPEGEPVIVQLPPERLQELLGDAATWRAQKKGKTGALVWKRAAVPRWVVMGLLARGEWSLPVLERIVDAPTLRPDGSISDQPGYDAVTRTIYDPGATVFPSVPESPTNAETFSAVQILEDVFADFPFEGDGFAAALACLLSLFGRSAIKGSVPLFYSGAPTAGSGKGLCLDVICNIFLGRPAAKMIHTVSEDETKKRLFALALEGAPIAYFDNVIGSFGSPAIANVLTSGLLGDRYLGKSEDGKATIVAVYMVTGNNLVFVSDCQRRVVPWTINTGKENPEDRQGFRHPDLLGFVLKNRPALVVAALTILRGYVAAGRPKHGGSRMGSYYEWDDLVRGAVIWATGRDPLCGVTKIRQTGDTEKDEKRALLFAWLNQFQSKPTKTADLVKRLSLQLEPMCGDRDGKVTAQRAGKLLQKLQGSPCEGLMIERAENVDHVATWRVRQLETGTGTR